MPLRSITTWFAMKLELYWFSSSVIFVTYRFHSGCKMCVIILVSLFKIRQWRHHCDRTCWTSAFLCYFYLSRSTGESSTRMWFHKLYPQTGAISLLIPPAECAFYPELSFCLWSTCRDGQLSLKQGGSRPMENGCIFFLVSFLFWSL